MEKLYKEIDRAFEAITGSIQSNDIMTPAIRSDALNEFRKKGFPNSKNEEWKYTNVQFLSKFDFTINKATDSDIRKAIDAMHQKLGDVLSVVFLNGHYSEAHSGTPNDNEGIKIIPISKALSGGLASNFSKISSGNNPFTLLNTSLFSGGVYVGIERNTQVEKPIALIYINDSSVHDSMTFSRNYFDLADNSSLKIFEHHHSDGSNKSMFSVVNEIELGENSFCEHIKYHQDEAGSVFISEIAVNANKYSRFNSISLYLDSGFVRNDTNIRLIGEGSEAVLNGFYFAGGENFIDNHTLVDHVAPRCHSNELYKGIADDRGKVVFSGKIIVREDAQKTEAYQSNRNILLSDTASINSKPQLEINADDVKCSHGATSGAMDEDALFYLRSRGLDPDTAKVLLLNAFAEEVLERISVPEIRKIISNDVHDKLMLKIS
jgi:Fe-S cluster assembly protein SufD